MKISHITERRFLILIKLFWPLLCSAFGLVVLLSDIIGYRHSIGIFFAFLASSMLFYPFYIVYASILAFLMHKKSVRSIFIAWIVSPLLFSIFFLLLFPDMTFEGGGVVLFVCLFNMITGLCFYLFWKWKVGFRSER